MAEIKKPTKKPEEVKPLMSWKMELFLLILAIFTVWIFTGGTKKEIKTGSFLNTSDIVPRTPTAR